MGLGLNVFGFQPQSTSLSPLVGSFSDMPVMTILYFSGDLLHAIRLPKDCSRPASNQVPTPPRILAKPQLRFGGT